jgi:Amt family ammonium transporter
VRRGLWPGVLLGLLITVGPIAYRLVAEGPAPNAEKKDAKPEEKKDAKPEEKPPEKKLSLDKGDTAWMLVSSGLVLLMVPGLALFYGGMVRRKNILGTMMQSMVALGIVGVQWVLFGYCLAFGESHGGFIGWSGKYLGLSGVMPSDVFPGTSIPIYVHCIYQGMFAIITPALISGAIAERIRFGPYCLFILLWSTLVYDPLAHWVWAVAPKADDPTAVDSVGWLGKMGALDFAGGTVVHVAAGFSSLAAILVLKKRRGYPEHPIHPSSMVLCLTGAGLLWFGWFGFNGGSALGATGLAGMALTASQIAAAAAALSWVAVEWLHRGKPTALGFASGLVAGLVAITPASGYVGPSSALCIGLIAGVVCYASVFAKSIFKYDDSLDAFGVHGVGGFLGAVLTGVFASYVLWNNAAGNTPPQDMGTIKDPSGGLAGQVFVQVTAAVAAAAFAFVLSLVLVVLIDVLWGFTAPAEAEAEGLDVSEHGEVGFDLVGPNVEETPEMKLPVPRPATVPPNGQERFTVVVEGAPWKEVAAAWGGLCQAGAKPPSEAFRAVYPYVTTVQDNRFRFRGGDKQAMRDNLQRLFHDALGRAVKAQVEG